MDLWWAPGFTLILFVAGRQHEVNDARYLALFLVVATWSLRLFLYLARRNLGHGEDYRYVSIRRRNEPNFQFKALYIVFGLQGLLQLLIALPFYFVAASSRGIVVLDLIGFFLATTGLVIEALADWQLAAFKSRPESQGKVMDQGVWSWCRHPNYFGNATLWAGIGMVGSAAGMPLWAWIGPVIMWFLLLKVSGVAMLERTIHKRRPEYVDYMNRVPAFFPRPFASLWQ